MLIIKVQKGDNIDKALKQFKQKVRNTKLITNLREKQYFDKPSAAKRKARKKAIRINKWKLCNDEI
jgi:small subunit ribosomal protein S21